MFAEEKNKKCLNEICKIYSGNSLTANDISDEESSENKYPVYGGHGLRGYYSTFNCTGEKVLVGRVGAQAGNVLLGTGKYFATEHALICDLFVDSVDPLWLMYCLELENLFKLAKGAAQPVIAASALGKLEIPMPEYHKQLAFSNFYRQSDKSKFAVQNFSNLNLWSSSDQPKKCRLRNWPLS